MNAEKKPVTFLEKFSFGMGDLSGNLLFSLMTSYLLYFYTDVAGIAVGTAGIIMSVARLVDAAANPIVGAAIDKTNTRWGKTRPYLLFTTLPLVVLALLAFYSPNLSQNGKIVYALVTYVLYSILFTLSNVPYSTLMSNLTDDQQTRFSFGKFRTIGMSIGGILSSACMLPLIGLLGGDNQQKGFSLTVGLFCLLSGFFLFLCFFKTTERIKPPPREKQPLVQAVRLAVKSRPWVVLCLLQFFQMAMFSLRSQNTVYYAKYYLHNADLSSVLLAIPSFVTIALSFFVPRIATRVGKRNCLIVGLVLFIITQGSIYFAGHNVPLLIVLHILASLGNGFSSSLFFIMGSETIDHSEWLTGERQQGLLTSLNMTLIKIGIMLTGLLSAFVLKLGGYVADAEQSASAIASIQINYILLPIILAALSIVIALFYNLERDYPQILKELQERRNRMDS